MEGCYIFIWPSFFTIAGLILVFSGKQIDLSSPKSIIIIAVTAACGVYIYTQLIYILYSVFVMMLLPVIVGLTLLITGTMQQPMTGMAQKRPWILPTILFIVSLALITMASVNPTPSEQYPKPNTILYALDADNGKAFWISEEEILDDWTKQFHLSGTARKPVPQFIPLPGFEKEQLTVSDAPVTFIPYPTIDVLSYISVDTIRTIELKIQSNSTSQVSSFIFIIPENISKIYEVGINKKKIESDKKTQENIWPLWYHGVFGHPFKIKLKTSRNSLLKFQIVEYGDGLPLSINPGLITRPDWTKPSHSLSDVSIVKKTYSF